MPIKDLEEKRAYQREWVRRKRADGTLKQPTRQKKLQIILEAKDKPCAICHQRFDPCCMDFHHINPAEKKYSVSEFHRYGLKYLQAEIDKCAVLCAHCHRKLHAGLVSL